MHILKLYILRSAMVGANMWRSGMRMEKFPLLLGAVFKLYTSIMKKYLLLFFVVLFSVKTIGQNHFYAAAKSGLNLREKADVNAAVLTKIPYGEKLAKINSDYIGTLATEGMRSEWLYVAYGNYKGYVAEVYTLPFAAPNHTDIEAYLNSISTPIGTWKIEPEFETETSVNDEAVHIYKTIYKNGISFRMNVGHEWTSISI